MLTAVIAIGLTIASQSEEIVVSAEKNVVLAGDKFETEIFITDGRDPLDHDVKIFSVSEIPSDSNPNHVVVCNSVKQVGSRIPIRICRTLQQWNTIVRENQDDLDRYTN